MIESEFSKSAPMQKFPVEIVVAATGIEAVTKSARAAVDGGASRIELCAHMEHGGLTPLPAHIRAARRACADVPGLMVMIRERVSAGCREFCYDTDMLALMCRQIAQAANCGADGVVVGALRARDGGLHATAMSRLVSIAKRLNLQVTFHRAFDAVSDRDGALNTLVDMGVDRILTSGTPWSSSQTIMDGVQVLSHTILHAANRLEVICCGGVTARMAPSLISMLPLNARLSLHAYGSVLTHGVTSARKVNDLCQHALNNSR